MADGLALVTERGCRETPIEGGSVSPSKDHPWNPFFLLAGADDEHRLSLITEKAHGGVRFPSRCRVFHSAETIPGISCQDMEDGSGEQTDPAVARGRCRHKAVSHALRRI